MCRIKLVGLWLLFYKASYVVPFWTLFQSWLTFPPLYCPAHSPNTSVSHRSSFPMHIGTNTPWRPLKYLFCMRPRVKVSGLRLWSHLGSRTFWGIVWVRLGKHLFCVNDCFHRKPNSHWATKWCWLTRVVHGKEQTNIRKGFWENPQLLLETLTSEMFTHSLDSAHVGK